MMHACADVLCDAAPPRRARARRGPRRRARRRYAPRRAIEAAPPPPAAAAFSRGGVQHRWRGQDDQRTPGEVRAQMAARSHQAGGGRAAPSSGPSRPPAVAGADGASSLPSQYPLRLRAIINDQNDMMTMQVWPAPCYLSVCVEAFYLPRPATPPPRTPPENLHSDFSPHYIITHPASLAAQLCGHRVRAGGQSRARTASR
jgi:hypothetical protein